MTNVTQLKLTDEQFQARMSNQKMIPHIVSIVVNKVVASSKGKYFETEKFTNPREINYTQELIS